MTDLEKLALAILNSDRQMAGWPTAESRENIPYSDGYVVNAKAVLSALLPPSEGMIEAMARALCHARGLNPDTLYQHHEWEDWPVDERQEHTDPFTREQHVTLMHRGWRKRVPDATAALTALVKYLEGQG